MTAKWARRFSCNFRTSSLRYDKVQVTLDHTNFRFIPGVDARRALEYFSEDSKNSSIKSWQVRISCRRLLKKVLSICWTSSTRWKMIDIMRRTRPIESRVLARFLYSLFAPPTSFNPALIRCISSPAARKSPIEKPKGTGIVSYVNRVEGSMCRVRRSRLQSSVMDRHSRCYTAEEAQPRFTPRCYWPPK